MNTPISFNADLVNIKRVPSRSVIQYVFEVDKTAISQESRHALDDFQNADARLSIMVMPEELAHEVKALAPAELLSPSDNLDDDSDRKHALAGLHSEFFLNPDVAVWLNCNAMFVKESYKKKMGVESCADLTVEQIQQSYKEFGGWRDERA